MNVYQIQSLITAVASNLVIGRVRSLARLESYRSPTFNPHTSRDTIKLFQGI